MWSSSRERNIDTDSGRVRNRVGSKTYSTVTRGDPGLGGDVVGSFGVDTDGSPPGGQRGKPREGQRRGKDRVSGYLYDCRDGPSV